MSMEDKVVIAAIALILDEEEQKENKKINVDRSVWNRPWINRRKEEGCFHTLFQELKREDTQGFKECIRTDRAHFE